MASVNNRANQLNPNNWRFWKSRGYSDRPYDWEALVNPGDSQESSCGFCGCICNRCVAVILLCLTVFLIYFLYAKGLGESLVMASGNSTEIVYFSNNVSVAMPGTGEEYLTELTTDSLTKVN